MRKVHWVDFLSAGTIVATGLALFVFGAIRLASENASVML